MSEVELLAIFEASMAVSFEFPEVKYLSITTDVFSSNLAIGTPDPAEVNLAN